jgi:signal transduction histidine kinase
MRIVQEALTNVRKHSKANSVRIDVDCVDGRLAICVSDDGEGFDPARLQIAGWPRFGLHTMGERAESVGGAFKVDSETGSGTRVSVSIPIDEHSWTGVII